MSGTITLNELSAGLSRAQKEIDKHVAKAVRRTAEKVADTQRQKVPVGPPRRRYKHTRDLVKVTGIDGAHITSTTLSLEIGPKDPKNPKRPWYIARFIESGIAGTKTIAARPFIENSYEPHRAAHEKAVQLAALTGAFGFLTK